MACDVLWQHVLATGLAVFLTRHSITLYRSTILQTKMYSIYKFIFDDIYDIPSKNSSKTNTIPWFDARCFKILSPPWLTSARSLLWNLRRFWMMSRTMSPQLGGSPYLTWRLLLFGKKSTPQFHKSDKDTFRDIHSYEKMIWYDLIWFDLIWCNMLCCFFSAVVAMMLVLLLDVFGLAWCWCWCCWLLVVVCSCRCCHCPCHFFQIFLLFLDSVGVCLAWRSGVRVKRLPFLDVQLGSQAEQKDMGHPGLCLWLVKRSWGGGSLCRALSFVGAFSQVLSRGAVMGRWKVMKSCWMLGYLSYWWFWPAFNRITLSFPHYLMFLPQTHNRKVSN